MFLAVLLVLGAFIGGYQIKGIDKQTSTESDRVQKLKELTAQMNAEEGTAPSGAETTTSGGGAGQKMGLDEIIVFAVILAITPYAIDITLQKRATRRKEELYTEFLFKLSELMRGGLDPIKSVKELSRTDLGILTANVRVASTAMLYGKGFEESMKSMAKNLRSELISRYTTLVVQASYSGGAVADLILKASEDMRSIIGIEREKEGNLSQYVLIFYFAQGIIFFIVMTLTSSLLPYVANLGPTSPFGVNKLVNVDFSRGFFHLIMINAFFGGLIIGKIAEGEARHGLKHASILMAAGYVACAVFILPPPVIPSAQQINITPINSDNLEGLPSLPMKDSISFRITDKDGNPLNRTTVQFNIFPSGSVTPTSDTSDNDGIVKVKATLGDASGTYFVVASAQGQTSRVKITAGSA